MELRVIDGERAGSRIYHCSDGYYYHYNNEFMNPDGNGRGEVYLRCHQHYRSGCRGKATLIVSPDGDQWRNTEQHTCAPNRTYAQVLLLKQTIIQESTRMAHYETPGQVVERVRNMFPAHISAQVTLASMKSMIQRARSARYPPVPVTLHALGNVLHQHQQLTLSLDGTDNLFAGVVNGPGGTTSIVFVSQRMRRFMSRVRIVFSDGTFGSRPNTPHCAQVLQIVTVVRNAVVPLVQVLMSGKTEVEYTLVLNHIRQLVPQFQPTQVMTDFETGLQNAWKTVFQNAQVNGCYWHFCRAILKKTREMGLVPLMNGNRPLKSLVRSFCAVPLLPPNLTERGVESLLREAHRLELFQALDDFFQYFIDTWMRGPFYQSLCVFGLRHRTNNVAESANKILRSKTGAHQPGLWHFISALRKFEAYGNLQTRTANLGLNLTGARKLSAVNNDLRIRNYTRDLFGGTISINRFLHLASTRVLNVFDQFVV